MSQEQTGQSPARMGRRAALRAGAALGVAGAGLTVGSAAASPAAQGGWRSEHLEWDFLASTISTITQAGGGPPQRGDFFSVWGPVFAMGDPNRAELGKYHCFGVWTSPASDTAAPYNRLVTLQFHLGDRGQLFGVINEGNPPGTPDPVGVIQGGLGRFAGAQGTFIQTLLSADPPFLVRAKFDLLIPGQG